MIYWELFYVFFLIGLFTFGGGYAMIPLITDQVLSRGWATQVELTDFIAISEATPGPFAINISTFIGSQVGGVWGSVCATLGVILPSFIIILIIAFILEKFMKNRFVKAGLDGVRPVVVALIASTALFMFIQLIFFNNGSIYGDFYFDLKSFTLLILLGVFYFAYGKIRKKKMNPIILLVIAAILGMLIFSV
ncbi:MAG: chromate transporter [Coprobacillus sp.]|nr:chromate transporter [Coprobacillus sp.]